MTLDDKNRLDLIQYRLDEAKDTETDGRSAGSFF